jgi:hypothetical protein
MTFVRKIVLCAGLLVLLPFSFNTSAIEPLSEESVVMCHGCNEQQKKNVIYQKAVDEFGWENYDPLTQLDTEVSPRIIYSFDFTNKTVSAFWVYYAYDFATRRPYTVEALNASFVPNNIKLPWIEFVDKVNSYATQDIDVPFDGFDFLTNYNTRQDVYDYARVAIDSDISGIRLGFSSVIQAFGSLAGVTISGAFSNITINFSDGVTVTLRIATSGSTTISDILNIQLEYVPDSAIYTDEEGTEVRLPDDPSDGNDLLDFELVGSENDFDNIDNLFDRNGFSGSGSFAGGNYSMSNGMLTCYVNRTTVGEDEDGNPKYTYRYTCQ